MDRTEANRIRWDGGPEPFYEVWYAIFVDPATGDGYWVRYTLLNPRDDRAEAGATLWFAHTSRADPARSLAVTRHFPAGTFAAPAGSDELRLAAGEDGANAAAWTRDHFSGAIADAGRDVRWDLHFDDGPGDGEAHLLLPPALRRIGDRRAVLTIPRPRAAVSGRVSIDGRVVDLAAAPGHQAHHFGRERAAAWDWAHCAHFAEDDAAVVEALAPKLAGGRIKPTFLHLRTRDRAYLCDRPADLVRNRSAAGFGWWRFVGHHGGCRIEVHFACDPVRVLPFTYHSTSYAPSRCWNTQTADCLVRVVEDDRTILTLRSHGLGSAEMHRSALGELPYEDWAARASAG